ncbi:MAG: putative dehydrogenase [Algoriphagus sp.]
MKALFIGYGSIARKHSIALKRAESDVVIFALRRTSEASEETGVINISNWENIPSDIDIILITNPTSEHEQTLIKALKLKKPIFLEKPPMHKLSNAEELVETVKQSGSLVYSAFNMRFHPLIKWCKEHVNVKDVLEVSAYCGSYLPDWRPGSDYKMGYSAMAELGGGVHLDLIHELDYIKYIFGDPKSTQSNLRKVSSLEINSIDSASYWLNYNGFTASIRLNYFRKQSKRHLEIVQKDSALQIDLINFVITDEGGRVLFSAPKDIQETYDQQMLYFLEAVKQEKLTMNDFESSIETLKYCLNEG